MVRKIIILISIMLTFSGTLFFIEKFLSVSLNL